METKSPLSAGRSETAAIGPAQRDTSSISLRNRRLQVVAAANAATSVRVPVLPQNREYLKVLRRAELLAWKSAGADRKRSAVSQSARLPMREPDRAEGRLYALLFLLCSLTLLSELGALWHSAPGWHAFVEFVRLLRG